MSAVLRPVSEVLRPMRGDDLSEVSAIEIQSYDFPWTVGIFGDCLRVGYHCRVIETCGRVAGYAILSVGSDEAHVLNLCVAPDCRRRGVGRRLLVNLVNMATEAGVERMYLEVRPSNDAARGLYRDAGFREVGRRQDYYRAHEGREDAIVLRLRLTEGSLALRLARDDRRALPR